MIQWLLTLKMQLFILSFSSGQRTAYSQEQGDALKKKCKLHLLKKLRIDHLWLWCCVINNNNLFKVFKYPREDTKVSAEQHWRCWRRWSKQHIECEWAGIIIIMALCTMLEHYGAWKLLAWNLLHVLFCSVLVI